MDKLWFWLILTIAGSVSAVWGYVFLTLGVDLGLILFIEGFGLTFAGFIQQLRATAIQTQQATPTKRTKEDSRPDKTQSESSQLQA